MSLRTDYTGPLDAALLAARAAGVTEISVTSLATITAAMAAAAASGIKIFTVKLTVQFQPADIRLGGCLWHAYQTGILQALASEDIMGNEVSVELDTSDVLVTSVSLNFSF
jgi:hypothetical protein